MDEIQIDGGSDTMINIIFNIDEQTKNSYEQMDELLKEKLGFTLMMKSTATIQGKRCIYRLRDKTLKLLKLLKRLVYP